MSTLVEPGTQRQIASFRTQVWWASAGLVLVGGLLSGVLLMRTLALLGDQGRDSWNVCAAVLHADCDDALRSTQSRQLGLPLAGWGVLYYATLGCLLGLGAVLRDDFADEAHAAAAAVSLVGSSGSLMLLIGVVLLQWAPACPLCFVIHAINLTLPVVLFQRPGGARAVVSRWRSGWVYAVGISPTTMPHAAWKSVTFLIPALVAVAVYQWVFVEVALRQRSGPSAMAIIQDYQQQPAREIPIDEADPQAGPADAPVTMVVFSSFTCNGCRQLARELKDLQAHFHGKLRVVFKHFPLAPECNPQVTAAKHPRSCVVAHWAEAAHRQGKFWEAHDGLFALPDMNEPALQDLGEQLALDAPQLEQTRQDASTLDRIRANAVLGGELGVNATPTVFLNNRLVSRLDAGVLDILIHELLGEPGH
jgi:protein-disulfide isomerase/uncharacterized membrane protein